MPSHRHPSAKPPVKSSTGDAARKPARAEQEPPSDPVLRPGSSGRHPTREQENHITPDRQ